MGRFILLSFASNAAEFVTECYGIEVSDFTPISSKCLNTATLDSECCGIEGSDFKYLFSVKSECRGIGL